MKFELTEAQVHNLKIFLDRVEYKGFNEVSAISELIYVFENPIQEDTPEDE